MEELKFLEEQQVAPELIKRVEEFRSQYEVVPETAGRIVKPSIPFYGKEVPPDRYGSSGKGNQGRKYNGDPVPVRYEKDQ